MHLRLYWRPILEVGFGSSLTRGNTITLLWDSFQFKGLNLSRNVSLVGTLYSIINAREVKEEGRKAQSTSSDADGDERNSELQLSYALWPERGGASCMHDARKRFTKISLR